MMAKDAYLQWLSSSSSSTKKPKASSAACVTKSCSTIWNQQNKTCTLCDAPSITNDNYLCFDSDITFQTQGWYTGTLQTSQCSSASQVDNTGRLQSCLNDAAWLIFKLWRSNHISDALISVHWPRVPDWIQYKVAMLPTKFSWTIVSCQCVRLTHTVHSATTVLYDPSIMSTISSRDSPVATT